MKMSLKNKEWKEFFLYEIFSNIKRGERLIESDRKVGNLPYYSASSTNNGLTDFISNPLFVENDKIIITTFCDAYFVEGEFTASDEITMFSNNNLNKYTGLFISTMISSNKSKYAFGRKAFSERLKRQKIFLPITKNGKPDYIFMETFIREKEQKKIKSYKGYAEKRLNELEKTKRIVSLADKELKQFKVGLIFEIESCKCAKVAELENGKLPYVGATNRNNGVLRFVKPINNMITKGNCIAFICDGEGSVGYSVYKKEDFIGSTTVKIGRNDKLNKYIGAFITTIADTVRNKYNFGFKRNETHLKNEVLMLPTTIIGKPDYNFMENYMKSLELKKIQKYLQYKNV